MPIAALSGAVAAQLTSPMLGYTLGTALFSLGIASLDDAPAVLLDGLSTRLLVSLGLWSYSIYLWQQPFYRFALDGTLGRFTALALSLAAGLLSFYVVEQPARRWLNRNWKRRPVQAAAADSTESVRL
jgi:peptidoglycan/LPS O-acetylase OafA/YrhL